ncbi:MAG: hypothetical protein ABSB68_17330 [Acidimicrobiales bacterium]
MRQLADHVCRVLQPLGGDEVRIPEGGHHRSSRHLHPEQVRRTLVGQELSPVSGHAGHGATFRRRTTAGGSCQRIREKSST